MQIVYIITLLLFLTIATSWATVCIYKNMNKIKAHKEYKYKGVKYTYHIVDVLSLGDAFFSYYLLSMSYIMSHYISKESLNNLSSVMGLVATILGIVLPLIPGLIVSIDKDLIVSKKQKIQNSFKDINILKHHTHHDADNRKSIRNKLDQYRMHITRLKRDVRNLIGKDINK